MISIKNIAYKGTVPLNVLEEEQISMAMPRAIKNEIFIHSNPKAKYPGIKYCFSLRFQRCFNI